MRIVDDVARPLSAPTLREPTFTLEIRMGRSLAWLAIEADGSQNQGRLLSPPPGATELRLLRAHLAPPTNEPVTLAMMSRLLDCEVSYDSCLMATLLHQRFQADLHRVHVLEPGLIAVFRSMAWEAVRTRNDLCDRIWNSAALVYAHSEPSTEIVGEVDWLLVYVDLNVGNIVIYDPAGASAIHYQLALDMAILLTMLHAYHRPEIGRAHV